MANTFLRLPLYCAILGLSQGAVAEESDSQSHELTKVIVSGGKLDRDLQATTSGISVIDSEALEANSTFNLTESLTLAPNVSTNGRGGFSIRGINAEGGPTSDTATADTAGIVMDGAYFDADLLEMGLALWDVEKVQVYKGPQSTSQGKNALAGTIIVDSNNPVFDTEGSVRLGFGSDNTQISSLMYNQALTDTLALRFAGERVYTDGQIENKFNGDKDEDRNEHLNGRFKLLFQPSETFSALLTVGQDKVEQGDGRACGENTIKENVFTCKDGNFTAFRDQRGEINQRVNYQILKLENTFNDQWTLTSITSNSRKDKNKDTDADGMAPTNSTYTKANELGLRKEFEEDKSISQEFRLTFENNTIRSSFGYFFGKSEETRGYDFLLANPLDLYLPGFYAATSSAPFPPYANGVSETVLQTQYTDEGSTREATNHALFAELDWNVTSDTTALFGLRFENEKNKNTSSVTATNVNQADMLALGPRANPVFSAIKAGSDAGDPASQQFWSVLSAYMAAAQVDPDNLENDSLNKILNTLAAAGSNTSEKDNVNQVFLPKIGIRHQFSENIGAGYVMTQGYRSGGITLNPINTVKPTVEYDPEYVTNHEISFRSQWLEQQLTVNANAYYMKWEDQQVQVVGSNFYDRYISNAGSSTLKGLELDANYQGHNGLRLFANAGIAKTRYEDFTSGGKDYSGNQFQYSPEKTAAAGIGFDQGIGYSAYLISNHSGEMYLDNDNDRKLAAYTVTNLRLGYAADVWKINAYVNNLLDKRANAYEYSYDDYAPDPSFVLYSDYAYLVPKRSFGLVAQYDF